MVSRKETLLLRTRGDNSSKNQNSARTCNNTALEGETFSWDINLYASVLHMRGKELVCQPYKSYSRNGRKCYYLCWNGECYSHDAMYGQASFDLGDKVQESVFGNEEERGKEMSSDTIMVMNLLQQAEDAVIQEDEDGVMDTSRYHALIASVLGRIHGEYSFLLYCPSECDHDYCMSGDGNGHVLGGGGGCGGLIYFGRDPLGRRSLVMFTTTTATKTEDDTMSNQGRYSRWMHWH